MDEEDRDPLTEQVIGAAIEVHRILGPGLLETVYHRCLKAELDLRGIKVETEVAIPIVYKGMRLDCDVFMDLVVPGRLVI